MISGSILPWMFLAFCIACLIIAGIVVIITRFIAKKKSPVIIGLLTGLCFGLVGVGYVYITRNIGDGLEAGVILLYIFGFPLTILEYILESTPLIRGSTSPMVVPSIFFIVNWMVFGCLIGYFMVWRKKQNL